MRANDKGLSSLSPGLTAFSTIQPLSSSLNTQILNGPKTNNLPFCNVIVSPALPLAVCSPYTPWRCFVLFPSDFSCFREKEEKSEGRESRKGDSGTQTSNIRDEQETNKKKKMEREKISATQMAVRHEN